MTRRAEHVAYDLSEEEMAALAKPIEQIDFLRRLVREQMVEIDKLHAEARILRARLTIASDLVDLARAKHAELEARERHTFDILARTQTERDAAQALARQLARRLDDLRTATKAN